MKKLILLISLISLNVVFGQQDLLLVSKKQFEVNSISNGLYPTVARVNFGVPITATDGKINWEGKNTDGAFTGVNLNVDTGSMYTTDTAAPIENLNVRHSSIPAYIDQSTFDDIFIRQTYKTTSINVTFPTLTNGSYRVRMYAASDYFADNQPNDIFINGVLVDDNFDPVSRFGYRVGGVVDYDYEVTTGTLEFRATNAGKNATFWAIELIRID